MLIDEFEKDVIRTVWKKSASPKAIARVYDVPIETILEILGLPLDEKDWIPIHKDKCFFDHGHDDKTINIRMNTYGEFLEDGDFEKYQPACYMEKTNPKYNELLAEAIQIPHSTHPIKEARRIWILMRFTEFQSSDWATLRNVFTDLLNRFPHKKLDWFKDTNDLAILDEST